MRQRRALWLLELPAEDKELLARGPRPLGQEAIRRIYDFANNFKPKDYLADSRELTLYALLASSVSVDDLSKEQVREMIKYCLFENEEVVRFRSYMF